MNAISMVGGVQRQPSGGLQGAEEKLAQATGRDLLLAEAEVQQRHSRTSTALRYGSRWAGERVVDP
jgi:hypothetical protein